MAARDKVGRTFDRSLPTDCWHARGHTMPIRTDRSSLRRAARLRHWSSVRLSPLSNLFPFSTNGIASRALPNWLLLPTAAPSPGRILENDHIHPFVACRFPDRRTRKPHHFLDDSRPPHVRLAKDFRFSFSLTVCDCWKEEKEDYWVTRSFGSGSSILHLTRDDERSKGLSGKRI